MSACHDPIAYDYVWAWKRDGTPLEGRKGHRCAVLARGKMNSCLIQFEDGYRTVTSRNGLRRPKQL